MLNNVEKVQSNKKVFADEAEGVAAWSRMHRRMSADNEFAAFLYSVTDGNRTFYYLGRTLKGMKRHWFIRANVVFPFLYYYFVESLLEWFKYRSHPAAFIHTHPAPKIGFTSRFHSREDLWLLNLPRIRAVFVIPYENEEINKAFKKDLY